MIKDNNNIFSADLYEAILRLNDLDEARRFFRDLLTEQEILEFGKRWHAAQMLENKKSYIEIEKETGLSSATIARISKWLNHGMNGYKTIIDKIRAHHHSDSATKQSRNQE